LARNTAANRISFAARDLIRTGVFGDVTKYEIVWNYHGPRWRGRPK